MLIKVQDYLMKTEPLKKTYRGTVVNNADPRKLGRVKCTVDDLIATDDLTLLPWIYRKTPAGLGGRSDTRNSFVPLVGSELVIEFPYNDIYSGFYTGVWESSVSHNGIFDEDYPSSYGFVDQQGTGFKVNTAKKFMEFLHGSGFSATVESDGTIEFRTPKKFRVVSLDDKSFIEFDTTTGEMITGSKGTTTHGGERVLQNPAKLETDVGSHKERISGGKDSEIVGGMKRSIGGSYAESILSNHQQIIAGNVSRMVNQFINETIGLGVIRSIVTGGIAETIYAGNHAETITLGNYLLSVIAGTLNLTSAAGITNITAGTGVNITAGATLTLTAASLVELIAGAITQTVGGAYTLNAVGAATIQATAAAKIAGATTLLGTGAGPGMGVLTFLGNPVIDLITGAPSVPCTTVFAGP